MYMRFQKAVVFAGVLFLAALAVVQLTGCSGGSSGTASTGKLQVALTDKQSDSFQNVVVAIKEVRVVPAGMENAADDDPGLPCYEFLIRIGGNSEKATDHYRSLLHGPDTFSAGHLLVDFSQKLYLS